MCVCGIQLHYLLSCKLCSSRSYQTRDTKEPPRKLIFKLPRIISRFCYNCSVILVATLRYCNEMSTRNCTKTFESAIPNRRSVERELILRMSANSIQCWDMTDVFLQTEQLVFYKYTEATEENLVIDRLNSLPEFYVSIPICNNL